MSETISLPKEEIQNKIKEGDMNVINGVLTGTVKQQVAVNDAPAQETTEVAPVVTETPIETETKKPETNEEVEFLKKRAELIEQREREDKERILRDKAKAEQELASERKRREEIEQRIQLLEEQRKQKPSSDPVSAEDDEFASDYAKATRKMVEELKESGGINSGSADLGKRLESIEKTLEKVEHEKKAQAEAEQANKNKQKFYEEIASFQNQPGRETFKTSVPYGKLYEDFLRFREDVAFVTKAKKPQDVDKTVMTMLDPANGKNVQEEFKSKGVKIPDELDKFWKIVELIDFKNGVEYDPVGQKFVQRVDSYGNPVRYASLDEAYKIKYYYESINEVKKKTMSEINQKVTTLNNTPKTLGTAETSAHEGGLTTENVAQLIRLDPRSYENNPELKDKVKQAYASVGLQMPEYRGRRT